MKPTPRIVTNPDGDPAADPSITRDRFAGLLRSIRRNRRASVIRTRYALTGSTYYAVYLPAPVHQAHLFRIEKEPQE